MTDSIVEVVRAGLAAAENHDRAAQQQAYMKSAMPFWGMSLGEVRALVSRAVTEAPPADRPAWEASARELWDEATHREERYAALALLRHRRHRGWLDPELLPLVRHLVVTGAWWDTVDELAAHVLGTILATHRAAVTPVVREWSTCDDLWLRRSAILAQLRHGARTDVALLTGALDANLAGSAYGTEFFIRKAVGWALRQHARTDPAWVRAYVAARSDRLSTLSRREALKHLG